jgi:LuxR family maltose regulon positive regulatory protein
MKQESASNKLLSTKLYIPLAREIVSRPRLVELLKEGFRRKLTLVSTPPGFGKTTLLSEWIDREKVAAAWVSLDDGDNDITRFLTYFITALQTIESSIGESVRVMLASSRSLRFEAVLTALINEISDIPEHFSLVLDDYHVIKAQSIHSALTFLLDHLPPQMHLVVATRADPPFHLARLRGRRQLTELRASSLRFTPEEVQEFLNRVMGLGLSEDESAALDSHTEGWITGLQMAAISMQGRDTGSMTDFIQAFTGSNRFVLDYLVEEVINRQTENFKSFLLQTAILDHLTGPLCDVVTGQSEGQSILERMDRANLFLVPLDTERSWYRYHRLFADLLQKRLKQVYPDRISSLHIRASGWYEQNGFMDEAIDHTIFAEDFERAANLIEQAAEPTLMRGETDTLLGWVDSLPDDMVCAKPLLCVYHAGAMLLNGQPLAAIESRLGDASQGDRTAAVPGEIAVLRALIAAIQGDTRQGSELSHKALELLPEDRVFLKGFVAVIFGLICILNGEIKAAIRHFTEVVKIGKKTGNFMAAIMADRRLASLYMLLGRLGEAEDICKKALDRYVDDQGHLLPLAGMVLTRLGELERERNDLEKAQQHLVEGIELSKQWVDIGSFDGYICLGGHPDSTGGCGGLRCNRD